MTDETSAVTSSTEDKPSTTPVAEAVANPEFISWEYPPYCELCNVYFSGEAPSKTHFEGKNHKNKLHLWKKYQDPDAVKDSKNVLCRTCWMEMNTQNILDTHIKSPAHLQKEKGCLIVQRLKEEYRQLKESQKTS